MIQRFPHFKQNNASDCGPTCLRIVAKSYNLNFSSEMLRKSCCISKGGVNLLAFLNSAVFFLVRKFYMLRCLLGFYMLI